MKRPECFKSVLAAIATAFVLASLPTTAFAGTMAGLQFDAGDSMDPRVTSEVRSAVGGAFEQVDSWDFIPFKKTRDSLDPVARDCFTPDCLGKAHEATNADAGVSVEITGEAQIYNWTVTIWDLKNKKKIKSKTGTCELCGRAEVKRTFRENLKATLIGTATPKDAPSADKAETADAPDTDKSPPSTDTASKVALQVSVIPTEAKITIDGEVAGAGNVTKAVSPGKHEVSFKLEEYQGLRETVIVDRETGGPIVLRVHLSRTDPEPVSVAPGEPGPLDRMDPGKRNLYGGLATGAGIALLGTGIYLAAIDGEPACESGVPADECPEIFATGGAAMTTGILGSAALTTGITLLIWESLSGSTGSPEAADDDDETPETGPSDGNGPEVNIGPSMTPGGGGGILLRGRF